MQSFHLLQDATSCEANYVLTLDSVAGSLDTAKGFRVEARLTVQSLHEKQFHALAAVDMSDGMVSPWAHTPGLRMCVCHHAHPPALFHAA